MSVKRIAGLVMLLAMTAPACERKSAEANSAESEGGEQEMTTKLLNPTAFQETHAERGGTLLDVRTPEEVADGKLSGATNIDIRAGGFEESAASLDKSQPVFVYCRSGRRSADAAQRLGQLGFEEVYDLDGGILAWEEAKLPVER